MKMTCEGGSSSVFSSALKAASVIWWASSRIQILIAVAGWAITRGVAQFADFVDAAIGGSVDLDHIHRVPGANLGAGLANSARLGHWMVCGTAVQGHRQDAGDGGFADAAMPAEDVAVGNSLLLDGVLQGAGNVLLTDDFSEFLWPVFAG